MIAPDGIVFWHDYGGLGVRRSDSIPQGALARRIPVYRVPNTSLAWTSAMRSGLPSRSISHAYSAPVSRPRPVIVGPDDIRARALATRQQDLEKPVTIARTV